MKKRFLILLVCGAALGLLIVSGLSCVTYYQSPIDPAFGMTEYEIKAYITPESTLVGQCLETVVGAPPYEPSKDGFAAIRD